MSTNEVLGTTWEFVGAESSRRVISEEPDTREGFPKKWRAFGPLGPETTKIVNYSCLIEFGGFEARPLVSADIESLKTIPEQLTVGDRTLAGQQMTWTDQTLDFGALFGGAEIGAQAYAMAEFTVDRPITVVLGATGDYWMQWWINGQEVLSTLATGNMTDPAGVYPPAAGDFAVRHTFAPGRHLLALRLISGRQWKAKVDFVDARTELRGTRRYDQWDIHNDGALLLPPRALAAPALAVRTDASFVDETIECEFDMAGRDGSFGLVFGAQDAGHYYWAYFPRWGQQWRARAIYLAIGKVQGNTNVTNLAFALMPNVVGHIDARHHLELRRRGRAIDFRIDGVKNPSIVDDTYGAGAVGVRGVGEYRVHDFRVTGTAGTPTWKTGVEPTKTWFHLPDTGYGTIRNHNGVIARLSGGEILTAVRSHDGAFYITRDPDTQVQHYLSSNSGKTWQTHGRPMNYQQVPAGLYITTANNGLRLVTAVPVSMADVQESDRGGDLWKNTSRTVKVDVPTSWRDYIAWASDSLKMVYRDSTDKGLTWGEPRDATMLGDWRCIFGGPFQTMLNTVHQLRNGTLVATFLRTPDINNQTRKFYSELPIPETVTHTTWPWYKNQCFTTRSTDGGQSWEAPVPMDNARLSSRVRPESPLADYSEVAMAQLPDGDIVALSRTTHSPFNWHTRSSDDGRSWRQACYGTFNITGAPVMIATESGYLTVFGREIGFTLHTSVDGGLNWDAGTVLDHDPWCNAWAAEVEPDVLLAITFAPNVEGNTPAMPKMFRLRMTADGPIPLPQ